MTGLVARFALGGILDRVTSPLKAAWGWITESALHLALAALAVSLLAVWYYRHDAAKWQRVVASMEVAQKKAADDQAAVNHEPAKRSAEIAEKSNAEAPAYYDTVHRAADAHAVRLRPTACPVSTPDLPGANPPVESLLGPDTSPPLVCRPAVEDSQIVGAAARAAEMHQEALDMVEQGIAVAAQ